MDKLLKGSLMVAVLLAGVGVVSYFVFALPYAKPTRGDELQLVRHDSGVQSCHQAAQMIYDVHWAAACTTEADGHAECNLPDAKAAVVNAWLDEAEARCRAEARIGVDHGFR